MTNIGKRWGGGGKSWTTSEREMHNKQEKESTKLYFLA
jgi:hypothetical protein